SLAPPGSGIGAICRAKPAPSRPCAPDQSADWRWTHEGRLACRQVDAPPGLPSGIHQMTSCSPHFVIHGLAAMRHHEVGVDLVGHSVRHCALEGLILAEALCVVDDHRGALAIRHKRRDLEPELAKSKREVLTDTIGNIRELLTEVLHEVPARPDDHTTV